MRYPLLVFSLALGACSHGTPGSHPPLSGGTNGPDAVLIRLVSGGGTAKAYRWNSDSVLWSSPQRVPGVSRIVAFDDEQGSLAYVDSRGIPGRLDLRVGNAAPAATASLTDITSVDGWAIYGIGPKHDVSRLTPSGTWTFTPDPRPSRLIPLPDGSLVLSTDDGDRQDLRRLHPPEPRVSETASVPRANFVVRTELGDRLFFLGDSGLASVRTRDFARTKTVRLSGTAVDAVATPSGDRVYIALKGKKKITIVDRFKDAIDGTIDTGEPVTALRMDPDGRYLLARNITEDSILVIGIGTAQTIGTIPSRWRADLPLVGPDGTIAVLQGDDVVVVDADTHRERTRFLGGGGDLWTLVRWNGFRPRAKGLDVPVNFDADSDSTAVDTASTDSTRAALAAAATAAAASAAPAPGTTAPVPAAPPSQKPMTGAPAHGTFTLSFAALLSADRARTLAASITVDGHPARVVPGVSGGTPIYRVVYGPFDTKDDADRAGKRTGLPYWVYEGAP